MLVAFTFCARPGKAAEMKAHLDNPEGARLVAEAMGAHRNLLLWHEDRMVRVLEFEDGVDPVPLTQVAKENEAVHRFLKRLGDLTEPGFDPDDAKSMATFNKEVAMEVMYDVRPEIPKGSPKRAKAPVS